MDSNNMNANRERSGMYGCGNYTCMTHVVRPGDTLYRLSREYGLKVSALMMANPFVDIYNLRIGDELCIPRLRRPENDPGPGDETVIMPRTGNENMDMKQQETSDNERVVDAEMNLLDRSDNITEPEDIHPSSINYTEKVDTY